MAKDTIGSCCVKGATEICQNSKIIVLSAVLSTYYRCSYYFCCFCHIHREIGVIIEF